ncbi:MAG: type IX secretion system outer membrane channel protein PorV [Chitinophagales bacterium]
MLLTGNKYKINIALLVLFSFLIFQNINAQTNVTVNSAVPFLRIIPDARGSALGDVGIATSVDANATFYNPSKIGFSTKKVGLSLSYAPWLRSLGVTDIYVFHMSSFYKFSQFDAVNMSMKFFSLGDIQYTDEVGTPLGTGSPRELALDAGYVRRLGNMFSLGVNFRYIYSNLGKGQTIGSDPIKPAHAFSSDLSATFNKNFEVGSKKMKSNVMAGLNISNMGTKVAYTNSPQVKDYLPANLGIGLGYRIQPNKLHEVGIYADFNKLLVPTPKIGDKDSNGVADYREKSAIGGMFGSLFDAPFKEELREWTMGIGAEYWYDHMIAVRAGYFLEAKDKGNRKFFAAGVGVKYSVFGLDFSYLIPTNSQRNPLDNTFRFTLKFDFAKQADFFKEDIVRDKNPEVDELDKASKKKMKNGK